MLRKYGKDVVDDLESREFESKRWTVEELKEIRDEYRQKIARLERGEPPETNPRLAVLDVFANMGKPRHMPDTQ